jgi:hypothetical protein
MLLLAEFIAVSEQLPNEQMVMEDVAMTRPDTATSSSQRVTCAVTAPSASATARVTMRVTPTNPFGRVLLPTSFSAFPKATKSLG